MSTRRGNQRQRLTALAGMCISIAACTDGTGSRLETSPIAPTSPPNAQVAVARYSPEELHRRNPADWVGRGHNLMLRLAADELKKSGVRFGDLCQRLQQRLSDPNVFKGADAGFPEGWRAGAPQSLRQTDICKRRPMFRNASYASPVTDLSPAAYALIDDRSRRPSGQPWPGGSNVASKRSHAM